MEDLSEIIRLAPGYISVTDLEGKYLAVNQNLAELMHITQNDFVGLKAGEKCREQKQRVLELINSKIGTVINWEYYYDNVCLACSSVRHEDHIITQAVNITKQKQLEERNQFLLKTLSELEGTGRRDNQQFQELVSNLINRPLTTGNESLIRLEVELRQTASRITALENLLYLKGDSFLNRLKELELYQQQDLRQWEQLNKEKETIKNIFSAFGALTKFPGGFKTLFVIVILSQISITFFVNVAIKYFGNDLIEMIKQ
jgi:PAS domain-containing protein